MKHLLRPRTLLSPVVLLFLYFLFHVSPGETGGVGQLRGQNVPIPDCQFTVNKAVTAGSGATFSIPVSPYFDNRTTACQTWTFQYQVTTTSGTFTNISFQGSQSASSPPSNGSFAAWGGTVSTGINPNTSQTGAISTFTTGCASMSACLTPNSFVRLLVTRNNFVGTINGVVYGYKSGYPGSGGGGGGGGGCVGTVGTPCIVAGPDASGAVPTQSPVLTAGVDGTDVRTIKTDANGSLIPSNASSAAADGLSNTEITATGAGGGVLYPRVFNLVFNGTTWDRLPGNTTGIPPSSASVAGADGVSNTINTPTTLGGTQLYGRQFGYLFNGSTNDRQYSCPNSAVITFSSTSGTLEIVGLTSTQVIRICHISLSSTVATNITLVYGTGTNCGTGTTSISGAYQQVTTLALDFRIGAEPKTAASNAFCVTSSVSATVGGMVTYAKY